MRYARCCKYQVFTRKRLYLHKPDRAYRRKQLPITNYKLPITNYQLPDIPHLSDRGYMRKSCEYKFNVFLTKRFP